MDKTDFTVHPPSQAKEVVLGTSPSPVKQKPTKTEIAYCLFPPFYNRKLICEVGTANQHAVQSSQLMVEYNQCDGRLRPLVLGLRYWARLCGIDQQAIGAMPAHTFVLFVIYYLQQCTPPILPILQQVTISLPY